LTFPLSYPEILARVAAIDPVAYGRSRNYTDGAVTRISPYLSRGVLSTSRVLRLLLKRGYQPAAMLTLIRELAWRDYWQQVWNAKRSAIDTDLRRPQQGACRSGLPKALADGTTGIEAIDQGVKALYATGYVHNHVRMYIAALACHSGGCHWSEPARWFHYHLLDCDWASNALSWQWVAGTNSSKIYIANQENVNRYAHTQQRGTYLDFSYEELLQQPRPAVLEQTLRPELRTPLVNTPPPAIDPALPTLIYTFYNLDPEWKSGIRANRILLLDTDLFDRYPVCGRSIDFVLGLATSIEGLQVFCGTFGELARHLHESAVFFRQHPTNSHFRGVEEPREWLFPVQGYYPSFFSYWKQCERFLYKL